MGWTKEGMAAHGTAGTGQKTVRGGVTLLGVVVGSAPSFAALCGVSQVSAGLFDPGRGRGHLALGGAPTSDDERCDEDGDHSDARHR